MRERMIDRCYSLLLDYWDIDVMHKFVEDMFLRYVEISSALRFLR